MMAEVGRIEEDSANVKGLAKKMFGGVEYRVPQGVDLTDQGDVVVRMKYQGLDMRMLSL